MQFSWISSIIFCVCQSLLLHYWRNLVLGTLQTSQSHSNMKWLKFPEKKVRNLRKKPHTITCISSTHPIFFAYNWVTKQTKTPQSLIWRKIFLFFHSVLETNKTYQFKIPELKNFVLIISEKINKITFEKINRIKVIEFYRSPFFCHIGYCAHLLMYKKV